MTYSVDYAKEMKEKYPDLLEDYTVEEVDEVWGSYSAEAAAGWLDDYREDVIRVFSQAPAYFKYKKKHPSDNDDVTDNYCGWYYNWK